MTLKTRSISSEEKVMRTNKLNNCGKGFTLIELMIVVTIIGVLAAIVAPMFGVLTRRADEGSTKGKLGAIRSAVNIYNAKNEGIWAADTNALVPVYLDKVPAVRIGKYFPESTGIDTDPGELNDNDGDWSYDTSTGKVWVDCNFTDTQNGVISAW